MLIIRNDVKFKIEIGSEHEEGGLLVKVETFLSLDAFLFIAKSFLEPNLSFETQSF